jgi:hypothetical protein
MAKSILTPTPEMTKLLVTSGSQNHDESFAAVRELAVALQLPLRQGVLDGDITGNIFERIPLAPGAAPEFPLDWLAPGTEKNYVAYTIPSHGLIPQKNIEGDYVTVNTYEIGAAIDWLLKYARDARWDIVGRAVEALQAMFTKKVNDDAWHTLIAAGVDRNIVVYDSAASAAQFTKRLVSLMKVVMRRNGGGNSTSINRGKLTDLYVSPEAMEDIRDWGVDQVDELTRREIFLAEDGMVNRIFGINLHDVDELGEDQEYQAFYTTDLSGTMATSDVEIVIGLDQRSTDSFVMPVRSDIEVFPDDSMHRQRRAGLYGWAEYGFGVLDNRRCVVGSL